MIGRNIGTPICDLELRNKKRCNWKRSAARSLSRIASGIALSTKSYRQKWYRHSDSCPRTPKRKAGNLEAKCSITAHPLSVIACRVELSVKSHYQKWYSRSDSQFRSKTKSWSPGSEVQHQSTATESYRSQDGILSEKSSSEVIFTLRFATSNSKTKRG